MPLSVPSGPFSISTLTLEIPAKDARIIAPGRFKLHGKDVLKLQTVLVTIFYPISATNTTKKASGGVSWLPTPKWKSMEGLVKYAGLSKYFAYPAVFVLPYHARLPYTHNAPIASNSPHIVPPNTNSSSGHTNTPPASATSASNQFPVGIFSHGLAGSRTTYSQYLSELASQGMVIASVEHRDGSAPSTTIKTRDKEETLTYFKHDELEPGSGSIGEMRTAQLELRQSEVLEVANLLSRLNEGKGDDIAASSSQPVEAKANLADWKGRLDLKNLWALGHSFGGATSIELIRKPDSIFTHALVLDPWLEPIAKAGEGGPVIKKPLFVINSEAFTIWRSHFLQLKQLVQESKQHSGHGWLMTTTKTAHTDFSDFPLLMPRFFKNKSGVPTQSLVQLFSQASLMEFVGNFDRSRLSFPVRDEEEGEVDRKDLGEGGQVIWHPLPDSKL